MTSIKSLMILALGLALMPVQNARAQNPIGTYQVTLRPALPGNAAPTLEVRQTSRGMALMFRGVEAGRDLIFEGVLLNGRIAAQRVQGSVSGAPNETLMAEVSPDGLRITGRMVFVPASGKLPMTVDFQALRIEEKPVAPTAPGTIPTQPLPQGSRPDVSRPIGMPTQGTVVVVDDPRESAPGYAGLDIRRMEIQVDGDRVRMTLTAYAPWNFRIGNRPHHVMLYFAGGYKGLVGIDLIGNEFSASLVSQENRNRLLQITHLFRGTSEINGKDCVLEFSWSELFGKSRKVGVYALGYDEVPDRVHFTRPVYAWVTRPDAEGLRNVMRDPNEPEIQDEVDFKSLEISVSGDYTAVRFTTHDDGWIAGSYPQPLVFQDAGQVPRLMFTLGAPGPANHPGRPLPEAFQRYRVEMTLDRRASFTRYIGQEEPQPIPVSGAQAFIYENTYLVVFSWSEVLRGATEVQVDLTHPLHGDRPGGDRLPNEGSLTIRKNPLSGNVVVSMTR